jgi:hypothetical protein
MKAHFFVEFVLDSGPEEESVDLCSQFSEHCADPSRGFEDEFDGTSESSPRFGFIGKFFAAGGG